MRRWMVIFAVVFTGVACGLPGQATPKTTPLGQASPSPSEVPSPTPSPSGPPLTITSASFHAGEIGLGYATARPTASGGVPPYTWSLGGGALPAGLGMDASGAVSGTPGALGTFLFTVQVTDAAASTVSIDTTINVVPRLGVTPTCPTNFPCMVEAGCVTVCGGFANQSGGMPPYSYRVVGGAIPRGMGLNGLTLAGTFPAPPTGATTDWLFTVRVSDGLGATAQTTAKFHVFPHITFTSALSPASCTLSSTAGPCKFTATYTLGTPGLPSPAVKWSLTNLGQTAPKPVPAAHSSNGTVTVDVPVPACGTGKGSFTWTMTLVLVDGSQCAPGAGAYCTSGAVTATLAMAC